MGRTTYMLHISTIYFFTIGLLLALLTEEVGAFKSSEKVGLNGTTAEGDQNEKQLET